MTTTSLIFSESFISSLEPYYSNLLQEIKNKRIVNTLITIGTRR